MGLTFVDSVSGSSETLVPTGATVQWVHAGGLHTVTSGTGSADPSSGALFNAQLTPASPTFSFTFNTPGTVPYYCAPHEAFGMTGTVTVIETRAGLSSGW